jgi:hypothetical protein
MTVQTTEVVSRSETAFLGLAPFLRSSIAGQDLLPFGQKLLALAREHPDDAAVSMNLSLAMQCLGQRKLGLAIQGLALERKRIYTVEATEQPAHLRVLMLMTPGDILANMPLECLLESGDIDLVFYYLTPGNLLATPVPEHDVLIVALRASEDNREFLKGLEHALAQWPKPVINAPQHIPATDRDVACELLQDAPGLSIPLTRQASRTLLQKIAAGDGCLADCFTDFDFPIILRPVGSHAGRDLDRLDTPSDLAAYLARVEGAEFFVSRFVDYGSPDGLFRKYRVAMIDGVPYACHMGISSHWMVHYVNAGMYEEAWKRDEEANFMASFCDFAQRHQAALAAIHDRFRLDYLCIDCAEMPDGRLLMFEIDPCMAVHAMDPEDMFPYKKIPMQKVKTAFHEYLLRVHQASR